MQAQNLSNVSVSQLSSKVKSKKELFNFLVEDCQAYLPPIGSTNVCFFKAIMRGKKDVGDQLRVIKSVIVHQA
jgi:hypothetical protein